MSSQKPSLMAPVAGVFAGVCVFVGVNVTIGRAIIPSVESVNDISHGLSEVKYPVVAPPATAGAGGAYQTICQTCHQAEGQGIAGAFPPLAGSEWLIQDPETPIRIALLGLTGPIEVKGTKFNAIMPPPAGITDEQVAEAVSHARKSFGNSASPVDVALVKKVRESLAGRTQSWTAEELSALRAPAAEAPAPAEAAPEPAPAAAPAPKKKAAAAPKKAPAPAAPAAAAPAAAAAPEVK